MMQEIRMPKTTTINVADAKRHFAELLGDFSKRISLIIMPKLDGSEYPTWAAQDGVPSGSRSPAWLSCSVQYPFDIPCGSAPRPDGGLSTSYSLPTPAWS